jgi:multiple sugar transport system substrate-binding protein
MFSLTKNVSRWGAVALSTVVVGTLAGCGSSGSGGGEPTQLSDGDVTISMAYWGGDTRVQQTDAAIAAFEKQHPNITVQAEPADWTGYWDGLATRTAAGDMPDLVQMDELYLASYADRGALADLGALEIDTSDIDADALAAGKLDGTIYGLTHSVGMYALVANTDLFEKYGVDETWSWDDFAATAKELTDKSGGEIAGTDQIGGFDVLSLKHWVRSDGGEVFGEDGKVTMDPASLAKMWTFETELQESGAMLSPSAIVESFNAGISANAMSTNKVGFAVGAATQIKTLTESSGSNLRLMKLPEPEGVHPASLKSSMYWSISSSSKHPAEAALLADFLANSEEAGKIILTERGIPSNAKVREAIVDSLSDVDRAPIDYIDRVTVGPTPVVTPNGASTIEAILQRYTQEVFGGQSTPEDAAQAFVDELQGEIDNAR